jgi:hypothetical protein
MSSFNGEGVPVEQVTQENREQQLVNRFYFFTVRNGPHRGAVILCFVGFGTATLMGIDPEVARIGDIAVEITHSDFYT